MEYARDVTREQILSMYENKTARYTFEGPLHVGAVLAGASETFLKQLSAFAVPLGIAFQIQDDMLGVYGDTEKTGKSVGLWGSSLENLNKRPAREKINLLRIYEEYFHRLITDPEIQEKGVRIRVIGRWREVFPQKLTKIFEKGIEATRENNHFHLTICLAYSGDDEMLSAVQEISSQNIQREEITADTIKAALMTHDMPAVDYLIRTGGEPHLSVGFMMWDIANAQLYFTEKMCPDFDADAFGVALGEYAQRSRRHGK